MVTNRLLLLVADEPRGVGASYPRNRSLPLSIGRSVERRDPRAANPRKVATMRLAKPHLDIGIFTNRLEAQLAFWQGEVGLELEEVLPLGGGNQQYRHAMNGSVFKLNA